MVCFITLIVRWYQKHMCHIQLKPHKWHFLLFPFSSEYQGIFFPSFSAPLRGFKFIIFAYFLVPLRSILPLLPLSTPPPLKTKRGHNTLCITLILASFHLPLHIKCKFTMLSYLYFILRYLQERIVQSRNTYNISLAVTYNLEVHCASFAMQCEIQVQFVFRHTFSVHVFVRTSCV